ncbi:protein-L-isoaspartate(D-aspartate) O-methyltransferase [Spongiactinospora rosea]|uniref:Protein-L-isoaspartate O-methyltransferase n=1 Tax=Spongiactinospora rosea TaxID=2248750 RepID=A0A366LE63_9ACTN|nr:methyltransferase domain-containing protein [Spongiactinospora rosea]RBQ12168.1 protein-L-isoaspartate(D-aspartate) O-methyltransferase [Spongiactinospora rosea]
MSMWKQVRRREAIDALAAYLASRGAIDVRDHRSRAWITGMHQVPRHRFVPWQAYADACQAGESSRVIDQAIDRADWWRAAYTDCSIIVQRADGAAEVTDSAAEPTCALPAPSTLFPSLDLLGLEDHHRVLEIGTGTGWTAALLAWRLGDEAVTTIEVDPALAETAAANLAQARCSPTLAVGNGRYGYRDEAPYDRVHVACGVWSIPQEWIEQTRPGGRIVLPFMPPPAGAGHGGQRLVLTVMRGGTATGRFCGPAASCMMLRDQRERIDEHGEEGGRHTTTRLDPRVLAAPPGGLLLTLAALAPAILTRACYEPHGGGGAYVMRLAELGGSSWARVATIPGTPDADVLQGGDHDLWDTIEAACTAWLAWGQPGPDRFGMTVSPEGQVMWLDHPGRTLAPLAPARRDPRG